jgi:hypothetical protein
MNQHLSSRQISSWLMGERTPQAEEHVRGCEQCRAEVARAEAALGLFRDSVRGYAGQTIGLYRSPSARAWQTARNDDLPHKRLRLWPAGLAWAAAILTIVAVPLYRGVHQQRAPQAEAVAADALLLEQVDAELSRTVPQPMEPLMKLVSWDAGSTEESKDSRGAAAEKQEDR